ncbi:hypothetical protein FNV43_RR25818 [Rhamnella rubrinervis]|uniref:Uncharacterized protein n=1 Tax=Rhamnella rubrinervis TaxID=2594499 RepID=A0A8K0DN54_9ROSA|nr:hypothetical protein FNV43_RR25818 [Rhamnella rubrinervis]
MAVDEKEPPYAMLAKVRCRPKRQQQDTPERPRYQARNYSSGKPRNPNIWKFKHKDWKQHTDKQESNPRQGKSQQRRQLKPRKRGFEQVVSLLLLMRFIHDWSSNYQKFQLLQNYGFDVRRLCLHQLPGSWRSRSNQSCRKLAVNIEASTSPRIFRHLSANVTADQSQQIIAYGVFWYTVIYEIVFLEDIGVDFMRLSELIRRVRIKINLISNSVSSIAGYCCLLMSLVLRFHRHPANTENMV